MPSIQDALCNEPWISTIHWSWPKGRLVFNLRAVSRIPISHIDLWKVLEDPRRGWTYTKLVGNSQYHSFTLYLITTDPYPSMKLAKKLLKHQVPFWWGQPGTSPGNRIHGDERTLSSMPLNQWEKWEVGTAVLLPLFACLNNYSDGYISSIWHWSQRATRPWKRLWARCAKYEAPSLEGLTSRLAGIRRVVSTEAIWPERHFVPSPEIKLGPVCNCSLAKHSSSQIPPPLFTFLYTNLHTSASWLWPLSEQNLQHSPY